MLGERLRRCAATTARSRAGSPRRRRSSPSRELVAEVDFAEWTTAGTMRHPSLKGLRDDKPAEAVVREEPS